MPPKGETFYTCEIIPKSNVRSLIVSIIGILTIIFAINILALWYLSKYTTNKGYWLIKQKWQILRTIRGPAEYLILGDSTGNQGIVPEVLKSKLGGYTINLCTTGDMLLIGDMLMLEEHINLFGPPNNVLIVHAYDAWIREQNPVVLAKIPLPLSAWNKNPLAPQMGFLDKIKLFTGRFLPLYTENTTLASIIQKSIRKPSYLFKNDFFVGKDGYMQETEANPLNVESDFKEHIKFVNRNHCKISQFNRIALKRIIELANQYRINIFIMNGPLYEGLYEKELFQKCFIQIKEEISNLTILSEKVNYIENILTYPSEMMQNVDHVIHPAAEDYTKKIALEISFHKLKKN